MGTLVLKRCENFNDRTVKNRGWRPPKNLRSSAETTCTGHHSGQNRREDLSYKRIPRAPQKIMRAPWAAGARTLNTCERVRLGYRGIAVAGHAAESGL